MSVGGGSFSAGRVFRGGAQSAVPSRYYMGFWPCQQADGDADDEQVTDRSGNDAHGTLGQLTTAEAWDTAGYLHSLSTASTPGHAAQIPVAKWTHRLRTGSLMLFTRMKAVTDGVNALRWWGNGVDGTNTGPVLVVTSTGAVQFGVLRLGSGTLATWTASSGTPYAADELHSIGVFYDYTTGYVHYYIDGALSSTATSPPANYLAADDGFNLSVSLGGRPSGTLPLGNLSQFWHAFDLVGKAIPSNAAALFARLHAHPRMMLRDEDFSWA